jgi:hypothetical protein
MKCPNEFILSQYADCELSESESKELAAHLEVCLVCRDQVAALKVENRLLVESVQGIDLCDPVQEAVQPQRPEFTSMDRVAAASIVIAILLRVGIGFVREVELPSALQWLQPWSLSGLLNWIANGLFYIVEEGGNIMTSLIETTGVVILGFLILGAAIAVTRRAIRTKAILGLISLVFVFTVPGYALDVRKAEKGTGGTVSVAANETVDDTMVVFADSVRIGGTITGDLIVFARNVDIQGTVQGNVIGFGQRIEVSGNVGGDIFAFGQSIRTDGQIGQNLWGFGQTVTVGKDARLNHDAAIFATNSYLNGDINRDALVRSATLDAGGRIGRDLSYAGATLLMHAPSVLGRNLDSLTKSEKDVKIDPGVTIGGKKKLEFLETQPSQYRTFSFYTRQALRIGAAFFMGFLLCWIIPGMRRISLSTGRALLTSGGIGFLAAVAAPIAAILLAITLIGIPVALLLVVLWLLGLYLAKIVIAQCIGSAILGSKSNGLSSTLLPLLLGLVIVIIAVNLPYIGGVLNFLLMITGLGALVLAIYRLRPAAIPQD